MLDGVIVKCVAGRMTCTKRPGNVSTSPSVSSTLWLGTNHWVIVVRCADCNPPNGPNAEISNKRGRSRLSSAVYCDVPASGESHHSVFAGGVTMTLGEAPVEYAALKVPESPWRVG